MFTTNRHREVQDGTNTDPIKRIQGYKLYLSRASDRLLALIYTIEEHTFPEQWSDFIATH